MTKSDLKTGMRVGTREGEIFLVIKDIDNKYGNQERVAFVNEWGFIIGDSYNDSLKYKDGNKLYDIVRVYSIDDGDNPLRKVTLNLEKRHLIWEREKEMIFTKKAEGYLVYTHAIVSTEEEFDKKEEIYEGASLSDEQYYEVVETCESLAEAEEALKRYESIVEKHQGISGESWTLIEYSIEETTLYFESEECWKSEECWGSEEEVEILYTTDLPDYFKEM